MLRNILIVVDDKDTMISKYESGEYFVNYLTKQITMENGQKLVRFYDPSGNLIEVRTPVYCNV